jgi:hypothetical protein
MEIDLPGGARCGSERLGLGREGGQQTNKLSFGSMPCRKIELVEWLDFFISLCLLAGMWLACSQLLALVPAPAMWHGIFLFVAA